MHNELVKKGHRAFSAQSRCWPGGTPGQLLFLQPFYFIQTAQEVWMIWERDHQVRRVYLNREPQSESEAFLVRRIRRPLRERRPRHRHHRFHWVTSRPSRFRNIRCRSRTRRTFDRFERLRVRQGLLGQQPPLRSRGGRDRCSPAHTTRCRAAHRHDRASTIVTNQLPVDHWHEVIADPTIADAVLDRRVIPPTR